MAQRQVRTLSTDSAISPLQDLPSVDSRGEAIQPSLHVVRYRGFVLIPQGDLTWLIRPERSPMKVLPFRAPASSLSDVKALVDWRLNHQQDN
jgi:hypothetical protein